MRDLERKKPGYRQSVARQDFFYCANDTLLQRYLQGLRQAGVPE